jgi:hypothetical protein
MLQNALELDANGYCLIPLHGKKPALDWKQYQERKPTTGELYSWFGKVNRHNIGVVCGQVSGGLFVKDFDDIELARDFYRKHRDILKTIVRTRRGIHFYFRNPDGRNYQGDRQDGRGNGGYVVGAGSVVDGFEYEYITPLVSPDELPTVANNATVVADNAITRGKVSDVALYLSRIESFQGRRGSSGLVRAAAVCRDNGLSEAEGLCELIKWNQLPVVGPPWSLEELTRAVKRTYQKGKR